MTLRWGIIGCGDVCEVKSGPALYKTEGSALTAVMRRDAAKAEDFARRHGVPRWTTDAREVIEADDVDIVYVATPPGTHRDYALQVAAVGKPCYVEKPMARSAGECGEMVAAFEKAGKPLFVAYYRRRLPRFVKMKQLLADGAVGTVTAVTYRQSSPRHRRKGDEWRLKAEDAGGGLLLDVGSHTLDILDHVLGPLETVQGCAANRASGCDVEDSVAMSFSIGGACGTAQWNFAADCGEDLLEITGTDGRLRFSIFGNDPLVLQVGKEEQRFDLPNPPHVHQPLVQTIVDELSERGGRCPSTGRSALRTSAVMDAVLSGYYGGRSDAFWLRPETWPGRRV